MDDETLTDPVILKKEEQYQRDHPLPAHLAQHERRRYENDFDVGSPLSSCNALILMQSLNSR
jgi:hypothetical protein